MPAVVAFDVIETTFSTETLRSRLQEVGLDGSLLELWFASALRDAFAMSASGSYAPFSEVLSEALRAVAVKQGTPMSDDAARSVVSGFSDLEPHPDAEEAFARLREAGVRIVTLTNGSAETTQKLLLRAGLARFVELSVSTDEVRAFKPHPSVYRHCAGKVGVSEADVMLVAAHAWDVHGAKRAGLAAGFVSRGQLFPRELQRPDVEAASLSELAARIVAL
jgi:2-haloacid dehalogenase